MVSALALHVAHVCIFKLSEGVLQIVRCECRALYHALCFALCLSISSAQTLCLSIFEAQILCCFWLLTEDKQGTIWVKIVYHTSVCSMVTFLATATMSGISSTVYYNSSQTNARQILLPSKVGVRCGVTRRQSTGSMQWHCSSAWVSLFQKTVCSATLPCTLTNPPTFASSAQKEVSTSTIVPTYYISCAKASQKPVAPWEILALYVLGRDQKGHQAVAGGDGNRQQLLKWLCCMFLA